VAEFLPTWSPDGAWIAFIADPAVQMVMRANVAAALANNGTEAERVTEGDNTFPVWIP
jgi:Tol biopolymer transport system component